MPCESETGDLSQLFEKHQCLFRPSLWHQNPTDCAQISEVLCPVADVCRWQFKVLHWVSRLDEPQPDAARGGGDASDRPFHQAGAPGHHRRVPVGQVPGVGPAARRAVPAAREVGGLRGKAPGAPPAPP